MKHLFALLLFCQAAFAADGHIRIQSGNSTTNTKSSAVSIVLQTNLLAGTITSTGAVTAASVNIGGVAVPTISSTSTLTNKRITRRVVALTDAATVTINADTTDVGKLATLSQTTDFANPSGTPVDGDRIEVVIKSTTSRALTYGAQFRGSVDIGALPAATSGGSLRDRMIFEWESTDSKWDLVAKNFGF